MKYKLVYLIVFCTLMIGILFFKISSSMIDKNNWKNWGGYDNPIDQYYLSTILSSETDDDRIEYLKAYRDSWNQELTVYLNQYEERCNYESDKKMVHDYLDAVSNYMEQSEKFLNRYDVDEETVLYFHIQAYRCAFIEHVRGVYSNEWENIQNESSTKITNKLYGDFGGFDNPIDKKFLEILSPDGQSSGSIFKWAQTSFMFSWGTDTDQLFEMLFNSIESDDLADYQESMRQWIEALDSRFWFAPEELNAVDADFNFYSGTGVQYAIDEEKGWIMRLYALQLRTVLENCPEIKVVETG